MKTRKIRQTLSPLTLSLLLIFALPEITHTQEKTPPPTTSEAIQNKIESSQKDQSLWSLYIQGGPLMHFIALCSIGTIAVSAYCAISITRSKMLPPDLIRNLNRLISERNTDEAFHLCSDRPSILTRSIHAALMKINYERDLFNKNAMEKSASDTLIHEETKLMLWVNWLNVFATIAPMIGLLGTVTGMIDAFGELTAGRSEPDDLAGGIGTAMITTAGGLMVGIPSMFCFFFFRNRLHGMVANIHHTINHMLDLFTGETSPDPKES